MRESKPYPDFFARFYDVIYHQIRDQDDHNYFMDQILAVDARVLEVGVGTGRFFSEALEKGADIYGIDISSSMLDVLKAKIPEREHFRLSECDVCDFADKRKYQLIIAPFRVFMHLLTIDEQLSALKVLQGHLEPGGTLIFDLFIPNLKMLSEGLDNVCDFEGEYAPGKMIRRYTSMHADLVKQLSCVTFRFEWEEDSIKYMKSWDTKLRFLFHFELLHLLHRSVFEKFDIFGDFFENPLSSSSREYLVKCYG